ncbi:MAG: hypothetical protein NC177_14320 [Ruminococcus flavefaciens]|nr:hypothetical protein [Ruminococcus flavefaciens]
MAKGNRGGSRGSQGYQIQKAINIAEKSLKDSQRRYNYEVKKITADGTSLSTAKKIVTKDFNRIGIDTPQKIKTQINSLKKIQQKFNF